MGKFLSIFLSNIFLYIIMSPSTVSAESDNKHFPPWQNGYLDIHHINTGSGDAAFFVFPDGTTLLFDAGDIDREALKKHAPLKTTLPRPDGSKRAGEWIANYIKKVAPDIWQGRLDYALVSHFHGDHYGVVRPGLPKDKTGQFFLTGIADVGTQIPIMKVIDRGYPNYDFPVDVRRYYQDRKDLNFLNYQAYLKTNSVSAETLKAGSSKQISLKYDRSFEPQFKVTNIKVNNLVWTGKADAVKEIFTASDSLDENGRFNENPLSLALKVSYGKFDYFTGGDNTGLSGPGIPQWFDVESSMASAIGEVDILALNHHGNRDATNAKFLSILKPRIMVMQSWISDHPGGEVLHRMINKSIYEGPREIYATNMVEETKVAIGPWLTRNVAKETGHVVIRVMPGGSEYFVFVLDDTTPELLIKTASGPHETR